MYPQLDLANFAGPKATLHTNFLGLAKKGYYDGVSFHRVIADFMIQGGDPTGTGAGGESIWGQPFEDEFSNVLFNIKGALSMANAGPNTNGSQFFIVSNEHLNPQMAAQMPQAGYPEPIIEAYKNGGTPWLDHRHTVFGQVLAGEDVVDTISKCNTLPGDKPAEDILINSVTISE